MRARFGIVAWTIALSGCMVGPKYKRPPVAAPAQYRWDQSNPNQGSLGNEKWFDLFQDDVLRSLIKQALATNYDLRMAAQRVIEAQGQLTVTRSLLFPRLDALISGTRTGVVFPIQSALGAFGSASWEPDFFGRIRRLVQASRAELLPTQDTEYGLIQTLVSQVASAYFDL